MTWTNKTILTIQLNQRQRQLEMRELERVADYHGLELIVCYEKIKWYTKADDAYKILFWEELAEHIEGLQFDVIAKRDGINREWKKFQDELIALMRKEIDSGIYGNSYFKKLHPNES